MTKRCASGGEASAVGWRTALRLAAVVACMASFGVTVAPQERRFIAPPAQVVAIRAGRLFDSKSGTLLNNQVVLIKGDRISDVGPGVPIPREARIIDLSAATVMPGMIDTHVHVNTGGETPAERAIVALANAQIDLEAGFTTVADMDSRGGFNTVDLRDAIQAGIVQGPRMQVVGQSLNQRAGNYDADSQSIRFLEGFTEHKNVNSPWLARAAVREAKLHGVDWIKMLNYGWETRIGSIERGKFADIIAVAGNPLADVAEMERVRFVMKGGLVVRNEPAP